MGNSFDRHYAKAKCVFKLLYLNIDFGYLVTTTILININRTFIEIHFLFCFKFIALLTNLY